MIFNDGEGIHTVDENKVNIKVIFDSNTDDDINISIRRTCFWKINEKKIQDKIKELQGRTPTLYCWEYFSVKDILDSDNPFQLQNLFDNEKTNIIIFNWDSINNDPIYGSDRAFQFFDHYSLEMDIWVEQGGIVILEAQTTAWKLDQRAYSLCANGVKVTEKWKEIDGLKSKIKKLAKQYKEPNPVLKDIEDRRELELQTISHNPQSWFPKRCNPNTWCMREIGSTQGKHRLYLGWFDKHTKDWEPLLYTKDGKKPIMLFKIKPANNSSTKYKLAGAYIVTTMFLGSSYVEGSGIDQLIANLLMLSDGQKIKRYYEEKQANNSKRVREYIFVVIIGFAAIGLASFVLPIVLNSSVLILITSSFGIISGTVGYLNGYLGVINFYINRKRGNSRK